jgi:hypothetical protein
MQGMHINGIGVEWRHSKKRAVITIVLLFCGYDRLKEVQTSHRPRVLAPVGV